MKKCIICNEPLTDRAKFCAACGVAQLDDATIPQDTDPTPSTWLPQGATKPSKFKKCKRCGKLSRDLDPRCWNCKAANFEEERVVGSRSSTSAQNEASVGSQRAVTAEESIHCPRCGSTQVSANKKGFGVGKALAGGFLTGGVGLLAGFIGSGKVLVTCVKCGKQWKAGR